jgi:hypothetical protein
MNCVSPITITRDHYRVGPALSRRRVNKWSKRTVRLRALLAASPVEPDYLVPNSPGLRYTKQEKAEHDRRAAHGKR